MGGLLMLVEKSFDTGEVVLNYAEGPDNGQPILLLHGGSWRWQSFMPILPWLIMRWHVYALDARGHGISGRVPQKYTLYDLYKDVHIFVQQTIKEPCVVFGHSQGGWQALLLAKELKDSVSALIIGDTPIYLDELREKYKGMIGWMESWDPFLDTGMPVAEIASKYENGPVTPSIRRRARWLSLLTRDMVDIWLNQAKNDDCFYEWFEGYEPDLILSSISVPVLLFQADAEKGGMMTDYDVKMASELISDVTVAKLKGVDHGLYLDRLGDVVLPLIAFLESLR
jgi:pimeloyl-ACP methyl ester carboxylesterase